MTYRNTLQQVGPKGSSMPTRSAQNQFTPNTRNMPQKSPQYTRSRNPSISSNGSTTFSHQMDVSEAGPMESTRIPGNRFNITNISQNQTPAANRSAETAQTSTGDATPVSTPDVTPVPSRQGRSASITPSSSVASTPVNSSRKKASKLMKSSILDDDLYRRQRKGTKKAGRFRTMQVPHVRTRKLSTIQLYHLLQSTDSAFILVSFLKIHVDRYDFSRSVKMMNIVIPLHPMMGQRNLQKLLNLWR